MGLLADAFSGKSITNSHDLFKEIYGGRKTSSGVSVNVKTAIEVSAVFACLRAIGNGVAQPPLKLMQDSDDGKRKLAVKSHPLYQLLSSKPNRWQTSFQWRQMISWHVELSGNHYSYINRMGGRVVELFPFTPDQVTTVDLGSGEYKYEITATNGKKQTFPSETILHLRGPSWNGFEGLEVVRVARESIGLSLSTEQSAGSLHKNSIRPSGVYSIEGTMTDDQHSKLESWILENNAGSEGFGKPLVLDRAAKWVSTQMTGVDAQALETRKYQIEEICRFFGVMPIIAGYSDKAATYASAEQMFLAHQQNCLAPRWTDYEQCFDTQLLTPKEREQGFYTNFTEEGLIRGSIKDTKDVILGYVNGGILTPDEGRALLDRNPMGDEFSGKLRIPANITGSTPEPEGASE